jgi:hypothetical protein
VEHLCRQQEDSRLDVAASAECCGFEMEGRPQERDGMAPRRGQEERERDGKKEERERGAPAFMRRKGTGAATE